MKKQNTRFLAICLLLALFGVIAVAVQSGVILPLEQRVYVSVSEYINPTLTNVVTFVTTIGSASVVTAIVLFLCLVPRLRPMFGIQPVLTLTFSVGLNTLLKRVFARERPDILLRLIPEHGFAFPSGHAMNNAALYATIAIVVFRHTQNEKTHIIVILFSAFATVCIGLSRIYLGVHHPSDVLAGWTLGIAVALSFDTLLHSKRGKH